ncbi:MAG: nucleotide sugar dehydrogenase [Bacteroidetes bacterium]|nr:nucleotide sugar dehydrogenase [Bacteroidota bacterium]MDA0851594.1 nucleotide sugar dehydrogenase [Pseudomonadota bacterium]
MKKIAIIGLGYVGLPLAVEFGKIRQTIGFDINAQRVTELEGGVDRTNECSDADLARARNLKFSSDLGDIKDASIYIVTVPTPIDNAKRPNLTPLKSASKMVGSVLDAGDIVIYESTVYPGATEEVCIPILEAESGLTFNQDFSCGYSPERINPGDKVNTLTKIKKITSGSNPLIATEIDELYGSIIEAGTHLASSIRVAEAAKVIENSQRDLNIAFVNELSVIFERLNIDTTEVLEAAGTKWNFMPFRPGMVGGHCIGVDPYYLTHKAEEVGYNPQVILSGRRINDNMAKYAAKTTIKNMLQLGIDVPRSNVGLLGITFKENCPDIRNSKIVDLVNELKNWNVSVKVADAWADPVEVKTEYDLELSEASDLVDLDALIIAVGHDQYRALSTEDLLSFMRDQNKCVLGDLKSLYNKQQLSEAGARVFRL